MNVRLILMLALSVLTACQSTTPPPVDGQILDLHTGRAVTPQALVGRLARVPRVVVGEQHDNRDHHALQLWLLQALAAQRAQGSLLLEMLTPLQQPRVDAVRQLPALPADLPAALDWSPGWDWSVYGPVVEFALGQGYPLLAANLDAAEIQRVYRQAPHLQGVRSNAAGVKDQLLEQIRQSHCGLLPESQMPAMLAVQQQRDRRMAERLLDAPLPAVLFAGAWHGRKDVGVPLHVLDLGASEAPTVLMLAEEGSEVSSAMADYVWYTKAAPPQDYCAQMREHKRAP
ncbi:ChaN family lipoprotein [Pseudomonas fluorescens]|uniref:ChaN family lipoprotein n=1 Tax=Pseudomonas fluorescens TaxID=294 RepID=A0A944DQK7_PSEFL|nr:ChaN family lipoprotein [Pseudomonas fluorescens]MBT2310186.1 ChaN family lipoprotein [Pseudomonas fluorescens]MBT2315304.1 ChaN family lipoprotein [Pseudomonas fluorescens]MBT2320480.1 ChaN family lipoprotein [Pseudomonas fluorescens]MBT2332073.1 ChaN family lipoprotein [Pseudomonas fluorescens]